MNESAERVNNNEPALEFANDFVEVGDPAFIPEIVPEIVPAVVANNEDENKSANSPDVGVKKCGSCYREYT